MKIYVINDSKTRTDLFFNNKLLDNFTPIFETKEDIDIGSAIKINGKTYSICSVRCDGSYAIVKEFEFTNSENDECFEEDYIKCPVCGYEDIDSFECCDSDDNYECSVCGSILSYERVIDVTYTTKVVKKGVVKELV